MRRSRISATLVAGMLLAFAAPSGASATASACVFHAEVPGADPGTGARGEIATLPVGISKGWVRCGGELRPLVVWTLEVDTALESIGVRDGPLFHSLDANPMVETARMRLGQAHSFTVFHRAETAGLPLPEAGAPDRRVPHRFFATLCDHEAERPLDCWAGAARVKMRVNAEDWNRDGVLDSDRHQVSIYRGERLQVLTFNTPHSPDPAGASAHWVEVLGVAGVLAAIR